MTQARLMTVREAADYCRLTPSGFAAWVRDGRLPGPLPGTKRYDRLAIDQALDKLSGIINSEETGNAFDQWMATR